MCVYIYVCLCICVLHQASCRPLFISLVIRSLLVQAFRLWHNLPGGSSWNSTMLGWLGSLIILLSMLPVVWSWMERNLHRLMFWSDHTTPFCALWWNAVQLIQQEVRWKRYCCAFFTTRPGDVLCDLSADKIDIADSLHNRAIDVDGVRLPSLLPVSFGLVLVKREIILS